MYAALTFYSFCSLTGGTITSSWTTCSSCIDSVAAVLRRRIPHGHKFELSLDASGENDEADEYFKVDNGVLSANSIAIRASTISALSAGVKFYLSYVNATIGWDATGGDNFESLVHGLPPIAPEDRPLTGSAKAPLRYYMNTCTFGYSTAWWNWTRWEKEIDWMALNGINAPLAPVGVEYVWKQVFEKDFGVSTETFFVGPAFLPWHWMGNIDEWGGPLSDEFLEDRRQLQHRILDRFRSLDMKPILPSFAGFVPKDMELTHSSVKRSSGWGGPGFEPTRYVDPLDPLFAKIGIAFQKRYCAEFGCTEHLYTADLYNELAPPKSDTDYLRNVSSAVYAMISHNDPQATWITQGWMFLNEGFWKKPQMEAFISGPPKGRLITIDLGADYKPVFSRTNGFFGHPWIWTNIPSFGGRPGMFGRLTMLIESIAAGIKTSPKGMIGIGTAPEAIETNPIYYELLLDSVWTTVSNVADWVPKFVHRRYGSGAQKGAIEAWQILAKTVYDFRETGRGDPPFWRLVTRPSMEIFGDPYWKVKDLRQALDLFIHSQGYPDVLHRDSYLYDITDLSLQILSEDVRMTHEKCVQASNTTLVELQSCRDTFMLILDQIETVSEFLPSEKHLSHWLHSAQAAVGDPNVEEDLFRWNARKQITTWAPDFTTNLIDYSSRMWGGLTSSYYRPRWERFFNFLEESFVGGHTGVFDSDKWTRIIEAWEGRWSIVPRPQNFTQQDYNTVVQGLLNPERWRVIYS